jgi:sterol desaturase/sphingolipid hydroxylase (fatty acid hydroxylase superfamily)
MRALQGLLTAFVVFQVTCLVQTVLHRWVGHRPLMRSIYRSHTGSHHRIYRGDTFEQPAYRKDEKSVSHTFVPAAAGIAVLAWLVLPADLWMVAIATVAATFALHVYLHVQYHLTHSRLERFAWFRRRRELHRRHHLDPRTNFGVVEFFWDRAMGTFRTAQT